MSLSLRPALPAALLLLLQGCIVVPIVIPGNSKAGNTANLAALPLPAGCTRPAAAEPMQARVLALVNAFRAEQGLGPLRASARIAGVAQGHACDNAARASIDHSGSDGSTLGERLNRGGYRWWAAAENTGLGFVDSPERMVSFWQNSPYHRANLLNPDVTEAGLGFTGGPRPAWVLNLGQPR